ncbi:hypothetical protein [Paenibacillus sp. NPDC055715]
MGDYMATGEQLQQKVGSRSFLAGNIVNVYIQMLAQNTDLYFKRTAATSVINPPHTVWAGKPP